METLIRETLPRLPQPRYEKTVKASTFRGRADAVHQDLIIEYEAPDSLGKRARADHATQQVCEYLLATRLGISGVAEPQDLTVEEEDRLSGGVGIATDGDRLIFVQRRGRTWHREEGAVDSETAERLLRWLVATERRDLSPENLISDFGPDSDIARDVVRVLAQLVHSGNHPKAAVIFEEWRRIFGIVYGTGPLQQGRRDPSTQSLVGAYSLDPSVEFPVLLFAVHTYYALLMKLLATELIVAQGGIGAAFLSGLVRGTLRARLRELESGEVLQRYNIRNAIEQDFFGWYPEAWTSELHGHLWTFVRKLAAYDVATFDLKPDRARDLLKDLYHGLIPEEVRHSLGEYYTPDWLAEHTLDLSGFDGDPRRSLLDPSRGSGTFLVLAVQRVRQWLADYRRDWDTNEKRAEAVDLIRRNIVGFDLNPLAVIASRTNYLFALGPLLRYRPTDKEFELPVYLTDSVLLPGRTEKQVGLFAEDTVPFPMAVGTFHIPTRIVDERKVPDLMSALHESITSAHDRASFVRRVERHLAISDGPKFRAALETLFDAMLKLEREGKNRVWTRLIRNRYAALFFRHHFDYIVGNPPHVNWESLTPEWRRTAEDVYRHYGLFNLKGLESRHGGGKKDIAALFTYAVADHFLKKNGVLALVLHVSLLKASGAGEGFRRFQLGEGDHLGVEAAHDFKSFQPFQTHPSVRIKTRTLTLRAVKGKRTEYPVEYRVWSKETRGIIPGSATWREAARGLSSRVEQAVPLRGTSREGRLTPWLTLAPDSYKKSRRIIAPIAYEPAYRGRAGVFTGGLNGAYFVQVIDQLPNGTARIRNLHDVGKIVCPRVEATIESDLIHPLLRGRDVARWRHQPQDHILMVQDVKTQKGYDTRWMQQTHPLAWAYFKKFESLLRERKAFLKFFDPNRDAFYSMYSVTADTFASFKVCWMDISATMKAVVVEKDSERLTIPEHGVMFAATSSRAEADYLAAILNSSQVGTVIEGYVVDNHLSTHPLENVVIPRFNPKDSIHAQLAEASRAAHRAASKDTGAELRRVEQRIDSLVEALWK